MPQNQEVRLQDVVNGRLLKVADYQRPYAWQEKQLTDLWDDIDLLGPTGTHYAGTLVLRDRGDRDAVVDDEGTTLRHVEVVDGQQRLTTCALLLGQIRRHLQALDGSGVEGAGALARGIDKQYLWTTIRNARTPRLTLSTELNDYWVDCVLTDRPFEGSLIQGQRRLKEAKTFFEAKIDHLLFDVSNSEGFERLRELHRRMTAGLVFLVYEVRSEAEVGVIFETLNERGRGLSDLEKVKNYLLYLARMIPDDRSAHLAARINGAWSEIFRNLAGLGDSAEDDLLRSHWLATQDSDARKWKRTASVKDQFPRDSYVPTTSRLVSKPGAFDQVAAWDQLDGDVDAYVDTLKRCSHFQAEMMNPGAAKYESLPVSDRSKIADRTRTLARTGFIAPYRPLLFAARLRYPEDGDFYADLLDLCERYSARVFIIVHWRSDSGASQLARIANELYRSGDRARARSALLADLWWRASDTKVRETLASTSQDWYWGRNHTYFLYEYERHLVSRGGEMVSFEELSRRGRDRTTEHILPQHPDDNAQCWWDHFSRDQHQELVHSLGNLVLTWDNSSYSNRCFTDKRERPMAPNGQYPPCYLYGRMHQERRLADAYREWTPANIVSRQQELAEWALQRWAVERPAPQELDKVATDEGGGSEADEGDGALRGRGTGEPLLDPSSMQT